MLLVTLLTYWYAETLPFWMNRLTTLHGPLLKITSLMYGPLRFAQKYGFTKLHTRLSRVLQSHWPLTLDQWDARCYRWPEHAPELQPGHGAYKSPHYGQHNLILVSDFLIRLATEANVFSVLSSAFYILASDLASIGSRAKDDVLSLEGDLEATKRTKLLLAQLPPSCAAQLIGGRESLQAITTLLVKKVLPLATQHALLCNKREQPSRPGQTRSNTSSRRNGPRPAGPTPCARYIEAWWEDVTPEDYGYNSLVDPLNTLKSLQEEADEPGASATLRQACQACGENVGTSIHSMRQFLWDMLLYIFAMPQADNAKRPNYKEYL